MIVFSSPEFFAADFLVPHIGWQVVSDEWSAILSPKPPRTQVTVLSPLRNLWEREQDFLGRVWRDEYRRPWQAGRYFD